MVQQLVTMAWRNDLWPNDGFATWVGSLASDKPFPEWQIWREFVVDNWQAGLARRNAMKAHEG